MSTKKSLVDIAYEVMLPRKRTIPFNDLWAKVIKLSGDETTEKVEFYNDLKMDFRFVSFKGNVWDLSERRKFEETYVDTESLDLDSDEEEDEEERIETEKQEEDE